MRYFKFAPLVAVLLLAAPAFADPQDEPSWWTDMLMVWVEFAICWFVDLFWPIAQPIIDAIPQEWGVAIADFAYWWGVADAWLPVNFCLGLIGSWIVFQILFATVKFVRTIVPFIG